jgi:adenylate kinase
MQLVLIGPPGSGKGTQARLLVRRLGLRYVGTGDILRDAIRRGTPIGKQIESVIGDGNLAPDQMVNELVDDLFAGPNRPEQYVLDGYPRTLSQAVWFDRRLTELGMSLPAVVQLTLDDDEVVRRISGRWVCPECGGVYHAADRAPRLPGICDSDAKSLIQRADDREIVVRSRLKVYHAHTDSLVAHYRANGLLKVIPSVGEIESIYSEIESHLKGRS